MEGEFLEEEVVAIVKILNREKASNLNDFSANLLIF